MGAPIIFKGTNAKLLNSGALELNDGTTFGTYAGSPDGVVSAQKGALILDKTNANVYQNTDGATAWEKLGDAADLALKTNNSLWVSIKDPTGFEDPDNIDVAYSRTNRTMTLTHSSGFIKYVFQGVERQLTSPWTSSAHPAGTVSYYLYTTDGINFTWSSTIWEFYHMMVALARYTPSAAEYYGVRECHGTLPYQAHDILHNNVGTYRVSGLTIDPSSILIDPATGSVTDAGNRPTTITGVIADEDLKTTIPQWLDSTGNYTILYFNAGGAGVLTKNNADIYLSSGNIIQYNPVGVGLSPLSNGEYVNMYCFHIPVTSDAESQVYRNGWIVGQQKYTTLTAAQSELVNSLYLGSAAGLMEQVPYAVVTFQYLNSISSSNAVGRCKIAATPRYLSGSRFSLISTSASVQSHTALQDRTVANQHPIGAIYGVTPGSYTRINSSLALQESTLQEIPSVRNYVKNFAAEISVTNNITVGAGVSALTQNTSTPLIGTGSFRATSVTTASATTYWEFDLYAIDTYYVGRTLNYSMKTLASTASVFTVSVYNSTDAAEVTGTAVVVPAAPYEIQGTFAPVTGKTYKIRITQTTSGAGVILDFDDIFVGPAKVAVSNPSTGVVNWVPTGTWVANTTYSGYYQISNGILKGWVAITLSGAPTTAALRINLPPNIVMDSTPIPSSGTHAVGIGSCVDSSLGVGWDVYVGVQKATTSSVGVYAKPSNGAEGFVRFPNAVSESSPATWATGDYVNVQFEIPVANWQNNVTTADRAVPEYVSNSNATNTATDTTSFSYGMAGSLIPNGATGTTYSRTIKWPTARQPGDSFIIEVDQSQGTWQDINNVLPNFTTHNTISYGIDLLHSNTDATLSTIRFHAGGYQPGITYGVAGAPWSDLSAWRWRVQKVSQGGLVGIDGLNALIGTTQLAAPAAATVVTLNNKSPRTIIISSPASPQNQELPSSGVLCGSEYRLIVTGATETNYISLRSSGGNEIARIQGDGEIGVVALVDGPTTAAHWSVTKLLDKVVKSISLTGAITASGVFVFTRNDAIVNITVPSNIQTNSVSASSLNAASNSVPTLMRPLNSVKISHPVQNNGAFVAGNVVVGTNGSMTWYANTVSTTSFTAGTNSAGLVPISLTMSTATNV